MQLGEWTPGLGERKEQVREREGREMRKRTGEGNNGTRRGNGQEREGKGNNGPQQTYSDSAALCRNVFLQAMFFPTSSLGSFEKKWKINRCLCICDCACVSCVRNFVFEIL